MNSFLLIDLCYLIAFGIGLVSIFRLIRKRLNANQGAAAPSYSLCGDEVPNNLQGSGKKMPAPGDPGFVHIHPAYSSKTARRNIFEDSIDKSELPSFLFSDRHQDSPEN